MPKLIRGWDFFIFMAMTRSANNKINDKKVDAGLNSAVDSEKSCSRLSRPGSGMNSNEI